MEIILVNENEPYWDKLMAFSSKCSWNPGKNLATRMENGDFTGDEQIFAAIENDEIAGFCVFEENGYIPPEYNYHPFINLVFVDEAFRGKRVSEKLIEKALSYGKELGLSKVYLKSENRGLYDKYGFRTDAKVTAWMPLQEPYVEK